jgi:hypothetical protein
VAQTIGKPVRTATSTISSGRDKDGNPVIITTNRRFSHTQVLPTRTLENPKNFWMILLEEFRSEWSPGVEGKKATVSIDGWAGPLTNPSKKIWSIHTEGDKGEVYDNFYKVTRYGCCGSLDTQIWFSLIDGKKVFTSNIDPVQVAVPNSSAGLARYFAWHSNEASISPTEVQTVKDLKGVLQYGSERQVSRRLLVRSSIDLYLSKIAIRYQGKLHDDAREFVTGIMLWGVDGKNDKSALSDFSVILTWNDNIEAEIPVENDELQVSKAKVSEKLILEIAK